MHQNLLLDTKGKESEATVSISKQQNSYGIYPGGKYKL